MKIFDKASGAVIYCDYFEDHSIKKAVSDMCNDIEKVSGKLPEVNSYLTEAVESGIYIGSLRNTRFAEFLKRNEIDSSDIVNKSENYTIKSLKDNKGIAICGCDKRGTIYGIYDFCEKFLGVDPLYFWTDNEPKMKEELVIDDVNIVDGPKTYKIRGWFMNDEDLFTGWEGGKVKQHKNYPMLQHKPEKFEKVLETALRMKQNLIIPSTYLDIDDPAQEDIVRLICERGLYVSQHHQEPMGVSADIFERYWKKRGEDVSASYADYPDKYEEVWTYYARKYAQYGEVIWQLGLRGKDDRPVWYKNDKVPQTMEGRGRLISDAIAKQKQVVEKVLGHKDFISTATLWMEGMPLHNAGVLEFPKETIIINSDFGPTQMWGEGFETVVRNPEQSYGTYYHVAYWSCGPHLVQGNPLEKIYYNFSRAVENGDTAYSILNVCNIRELVLPISCIKEITWDYNQFSIATFMNNWCAVEFGENCADMVSELYKEFYLAYHELENDNIPGQMLLLDGMCRKVAQKLFEIIDGKGLISENLQNKRIYAFDSQEEFIKYFTEATDDALIRWNSVYKKALKARESIHEVHKQFYVENILVQLEIIQGMYEWVNNLCKAAKVKVEHRSEIQYQICMEAALGNIKKVLKDRQKAEKGRWENWYKNDRLLNINLLMENTQRMFTGKGENLNWSTIKYE